MGNGGLPIDPKEYDLGRPKLDMSLPGPLPIDAVSTGRAPDTAVGRTQPTTGERLLGALDFIRGKPQGLYHALGKLTPDEERQAQKDQLDFMFKFAQEMRAGRTQTLQASETVLNRIATLAPRLAMMEPDDVELSLKGLEKIAEEGGAQSAKALVRPLAKHPQLASRTPGLLRFISPEIKQRVIGPYALKYIEDGTMEGKLWAHAVPEMRRQLDADADREVAAMRLEPAYKEGPIPYDVLTRRLARGVPVLETFLNRSYGGDVAPQIDKARDAFDHRLTQMGVGEPPSTTAKAQEAAATERAKEASKPAPSDDRNAVAKELYDKKFSDLTKTEAAKVNETLQGRRVEVSAQQGAAAVGAKAAAERQQPLGVEKASSYIDPNTGKLAPASMTENQAIASGFRYATPKQREELSVLDNARAIIDSVDQLSKGLITAPDAMRAAVQGAKLQTGAFTRADAAAATYQDTRQQFLGILSRTMGGERGVLTDRDIERIGRGLPSFFDTKDIRDAKIDLIRVLLDTTVDAARRSVFGEAASADAKRRIKSIVDRLEQRATDTPKPASPGSTGSGVDAARKRLGLP